ncbi:hypothetical protein ACSBR2_003283 [Camellia fascicularis]
MMDNLSIDATDGSNVGENVFSEQKFSDTQLVGQDVLKEDAIVSGVRGLALNNLVLTSEGRRVEQGTKMATDSARRLFQRSTSSAKAFLSRKSRTQSPSNLDGLAPSSNSTPLSRVSRRHHSFFSTRLPMELGCGESLMPLHSATVSSLLNFVLSSKVGQWGCLSEGTN